MKKFKKFGKRGLSLFLCLVMVVCMLPTTVFADEEETGEGTGVIDVDPVDKTEGDNEGDDVDVIGDHGGIVEEIENGTRETWDKTDEDGVNKTGSETKTETEATVPGEDGSESKTQTSDRDLQETTTNPTVTNPDGSTVTTGTDHTEGNSSTTTTTTTKTPDPDNAEGAVKPTDQEIADEASQKEAERVDGDDTFETVTSGENEDLADEDLSGTSDKWLDNGVTVTMKPGETKTETFEADVSDWKEVLEQKIAAAKPAGSTEYTPTEADQLPTLEKEAKVYKSADGMTITIVTPTYQDGVLSGYKTQTFATTEHWDDQKDLEDKGQITQKDDTDKEEPKPVREDENKKTVYTFDVPEPEIPVGTTEETVRGNTVKTEVQELFSEEFYILNEDGTYTQVEADIEGAERVVVGYKTTVTTTAANGDVISTDSHSEWGTQEQTVTTPIRTDLSAKWDVIVEHYTVPVTRAVTTNDYVLSVETEIGGIKVSVTGTMGEVNKNAGHGTETGNVGLDVDGTLLNGVGAMGTSDSDLHNRINSVFSGKPLLGVYQVTSSTLNVRTGAGTSYGTTGNSLKKDNVFAVYEIKDGWGLIGEDNDGNQKWVSLSGSYSKEINSATNKEAEDGQFLYLGELGLEGALLVNGAGSTSGTWQPHQFVIYDDQGQRHYVLCADFEVSPKADTDYGEKVIDGNTVGKWYDNADKNRETAQKVQAIALNGYWGTASGTGSLENVKQMMKDAIKAGNITGITADQVDRLLTDGLALTATQAAIWSYATSGQTINSSNPFGKYNDDGTVVDQSNGITSDEKDVAKALYDYLRGLEAEASYTVDTVETISSSSITVKEMVGEIDTGAKTEDTQYKYNTDVTFQLETTPSQLNDDLLVTIKDQNGNAIGTWRLAGQGSEGQVVDNGDGSYTIRNVVLAEGVSVTLNLHGTQLADKSAYLITAKNPTTGKEDAQESQTFIGVKEKQRTIDLSVDLTFTVTEPVATLSGTTKTDDQSRTDEYKKALEMETNWSTYEYEDVLTATSGSEYESDTNWTRTTPAPYEGDDDDDNDVENDDDDDDDDIEIPEEDVPLSEMPDEEIELPDEEIPLDEIELDDPDIPLADVPQTGDISAMWYVAVCLSAAGLVVLKLLERKERQEA